ncbi:MAG: ABC transporter permease [Geminicoccaceae bacterium]
MSAPSQRTGYALAAAPSVTLGVLFLLPFAIMTMVSVFLRNPRGFYTPGFTLEHYGRFFSPFFRDVLLDSLLICGLAAIVSVLIAFPFTYLLTRCRRRLQVIMLVLVLAVLSLSEVIVGFVWSKLLSRSEGLSNLLVFAGLLDEPVAWTPGFFAVVIGLSYVTLPYATLVLYPALSRLDPELSEAARTLGASPLRTFFEIITPMARKPIAACVIMAFVFTLGAYAIPNQLGSGNPTQWTITVHITEQAFQQSNLPFAAAMAILLMMITLILVALTQRYLGGRS